MPLASALRSPQSFYRHHTLPDDPLALYSWYIRRGEPELWIKDFKRACFADRSSDHRFFANQIRLILHRAAYRCLDFLGRWLTDLGLARVQPGTLRETLRLRLVKTAG